MKPRTLLSIGALLGAVLAFIPPAAAEGETPQDVRICSESSDGKRRWCITYEVAGSCGPTAGQHCDSNACWCGDSDALEWPGNNGSGLPLIGREAAYLHRVGCTIVKHEDVTIGDCGYAGWVCRGRENWCQDTAGRSWPLVPPPKARV
jgi:hypothetical protein